MNSGNACCKGCGSADLIESGSEVVCTRCGLVAPCSSAGFDLQAEFGKGVDVNEDGRYFSGCVGTNRGRQDRDEVRAIQRICALRICEETCERLGVGSLRERAMAILEEFVTACRVLRVIKALGNAAQQQRLLAILAALRRAENSIHKDEEGDTEDDDNLDSLNDLKHPRKHRRKLQEQVKVLRIRIEENLRSRTSEKKRRHAVEPDLGWADEQDRDDEDSEEGDEVADEAGETEYEEDAHDAAWPAPAHDDSPSSPVLLFPLTEEQVST
jgi:hypothetical protein